MAITEESKNEHDYQPLPQNNITTSLKNTNDESDKEDTLSLSDLPIERKNDDSAADQDHDKAQNMFEFFSPDNQVEKVTTPTFSSPNSPVNPKYFHGKQASLNSQHHMKSKSASRNMKKSEYWMFQKSKSASFSPSKSKKNAKEEQKVSVFTSPLKSKWFLVLLGLPPKIPTEGELKTDMKIRQSRHAPSTFFPPDSCEEVAEAVAAMVVEDQRLSEQNKNKNKNRNRRSCTTCFGGGQQIHA